MTSKVPLQLKNLLGNLPNSSITSQSAGSPTAIITGAQGVFNNIFVSSGFVDGTVIGQSIPAAAFFTSVRIDNPPLGGQFYVGGSTASGSSLSWNPTTGQLNIAGSISITGGTQFGNLRIIGNSLQAINTGGDVVLVPNNSSASVKISGSLVQIAQGSVSLDQATSISLTSTTTATMNSMSGTTLSSSSGNILLQTDSTRYTLSVTFTQNVSSTTFTTPTLHGFSSGQKVVISGTLYTIGSTPNGTTFTISGLVSGTTVSTTLSGSIHLSAGKGVYLDTQIPLVLGQSSITDQSGTLLVSTTNLISQDPIPAFTSPTGAFSDSGFQVNYTDSLGNAKVGFFGFAGNTTNFCFIPDATVTYNPTTKTKSVTGTHGNLAILSGNESSLYGNPSITLSAPSGNIVVDALAMTWGSSTISQSGGSLKLASTYIDLSATSGICIPLDTPLSFDNCLGNIYIVATSPSSLSIVSPTISIPTGSQFQLGTGQVMTTTSGNTVISSTGKVLLTTTSSVVLPASTTLQLGTPFDYIVGRGNTVGVTIASSGALSLNSVGNCIVTPTSGTVTLNASTIQLPGISQFMFGTTSSIVVDTNTSVTTLGNANVSCTNFNLNASNIVSIPINVPLIFGGIASLYQDTTFHINAPNTTITSSVVINGSLIVNGSSTTISSTIATYADPLITLSNTPPLGDIKDKGFEFAWWNGPYKKWGFFGYDPTKQSFELIDDGVNVNEVYSPTSGYANLLMGNLTASGITASSLAISTIQGNPNLALNCGILYMNAVTSCQLPLGVPIESGASTLIGTSTGWSANCLDFSITRGALSIGPAQLYLTDNNNFHISGIQSTYMDSVLFVTSTVNLGEFSSLSVDDKVLTITSGGTTQFSDVVLFGQGNLMGNASMTWVNDIPGGRVIWRDTNVNTPLNVSLYGNISNATWTGNTITLPYGGTGHTASWTQGSVVFVGLQGTFLDEDNVNFFYERDTSALGLQTNSPTSTLSIGSGNLDLFSDKALVLYKTAGLYSWGIGKYNTGFALYTNTVPVVSPSSLHPVVFFNKYGQVGIGEDISTSTGGVSLSLASGLTTTPNSPIGWTPTEYISSSAGNLNLFAQNNIQFFGGVAFPQGITISSLTGETGNTGTTEIDIFSIHTLTENRFCLHHSAGVCEMYELHNGNNWEIHNLVGDLLLSPSNKVILADGCQLLFGANSGVFAPSTTGVTFSTNVFTLKCTTNVPESQSLTFGTAGGISLTSGALVVSPGVSVPINFTQVASLSVPVNVPFNFGNASIFSDGDSLNLVSHDLIRLESNDVFVTGNLRISGTTNFTIASETHFDSGVITLGAGTELQIVGLVNFSSTSTLVTTSTINSLVAGDVITLEGTVPNVDGTYVISSIASNTAFVVSVAFPGTLPGTVITGTIRTSLTRDYHTDLGVQFDWYSGSNLGTAGSRFGFFGFDRASTRLKYIPIASVNAGIYSGAFGDMQVGNMYMTGLSCTNLISNLNTASFSVSGSNFVISGGRIDSTPIGVTTPSSGSFTTLAVTSSALVTNLNADTVGGYHATDILLRNGSNSLTANWNAGNFRVTTAGVTDTTLLSHSVVYNLSGALTTTSSFTFDGTTLTVPDLAGTNVTGTLNLNGNQLTNASILNSNLILSSGGIVDVSQGTITFAPGQISGNSISGGLANTSVTGNAGTVTNGVYTTEYLANSILKADITGTPIPLVVPEATILGRKPGGVITALTQADFDSMFPSQAPIDTTVFVQKRGSTMTGNLIASTERVTVASNTTGILSNQVETTYVTVTFSTLGSRAILSLGNGVADGHKKSIVISSLPSNCSVLVNLSLGAPFDPTVESSPPTALYFEYQYQSAELQWDNTLGVWFIRGSGARAVNSSFVA